MVIVNASNLAIFGIFDCVFSKNVRSIICTLNIRHSTRIEKVLTANVHNNQRNDVVQQSPWDQYRRPTVEIRYECWRLTGTISGRGDDPGMSAAWPITGPSDTKHGHSTHQAHTAPDNPLSLVVSRDYLRGGVPWFCLPALEIPLPFRRYVFMTFYHTISAPYFSRDISIHLLLSHYMTVCPLIPLSPFFPFSLIIPLFLHHRSFRLSLLPIFFTSLSTYLCP